MARIFPFPATRYNPSLVRIEDVVTQPYDKITPSMQQAYYRRSPYNLVRIILGLPELFDQPGVNDVYTRAAREFADWRSRGILYTEPEPCIFAYSQQYAVPGRPGELRERRGFIALGELSDYNQRIVFRHEQTLSKPKSDRLNLLRATRAHFGQIFMLYSDPALTIERMLFGPGFRAEIEVTDEYGVIHRVAKISDPHTIRLVVGTMENKKLIIADGHHRYETALQYSRERQPEKSHRVERDLATTLPRPLYPEAAAMMTFVNMDAAGLTILATHRAVFGLPNFEAAEFLRRAETFFTVEPIPGAIQSDSDHLLRRLAEAGMARTALISISPAGAHLLTAKPDAMAQVLGNASERQRQIDVLQLHAVVLERLLGISSEAILEQRNLRYLRDAGEARAQVSAGEAQIAFLVNPVSLEQLREVAFNGEVMPQKSTDFYPKLLSGLAIYALE